MKLKCGLHFKKNIITGHRPVWCGSYYYFYYYYYYYYYYLQITLYIILTENFFILCIYLMKYKETFTCVCSAVPPILVYFIRNRC